jgi:hypothetical protein
MKRHLVSTDVAAVALGITPSGVRKLIQYGALRRYGTRQRALVDLDECESRCLSRPFRLTPSDLHVTLPVG